MSDTSPSVVMNASPPSGGLTHDAGGLADADSRAVSSSRLWLASGSSSRGMNAHPWYSPRTASEAYQPPRAHLVDKEGARSPPRLSGTPILPMEVTTVPDVLRFKAEGRRFAMLTAYDYPMARLADEAEIPVLLVGDTLGMVVLGHPTTLPVTLDDMVHHAAAVARGSSRALLVGDLPFMSYQPSVEMAMVSSGRLLQEGTIAISTEAGVPVMAHLGLTPQS